MRDNHQRLFKTNQIMNHYHPGARASDREVLGQLLAYGLAALAFIVLVGSLWQYLVGALALIGAAHLYHQFNRH